MGHVSDKTGDGVTYNMRRILLKLNLKTIKFDLRPNLLFKFCQSMLNKILIC